jgi:hypothetical protein
MALDVGEQPLCPRPVGVDGLLPFDEHQMLRAGKKKSVLCIIPGHTFGSFPSHSGNA